MSIVVRFHPTNVTKQKYDESLRRMEQAGYRPIRPDCNFMSSSAPTTIFT